ncbi:PREDICTED: E3 ubiquitin-protein ligase MSL2-like [Priapulus caudatus]|uniref:E3 ubiquitin-protein ligase MSL2-like n=1 Tax=Priapulus caudatus TaxID=37621 RepID=A0ABM1FAD6_PRICU|nr:PREDICTED: E3 ubiquitin-protein ligase MSL2-like [Priapulus caudatus]
MNATTLYVTTCRYTMMADSDDESTWQDLFRLLPYLKSALSCCVCGNVLINPFGSSESTCQHHVCKTCIGGKMRLKPSCSWCKDYNKYTQNKQLRIIVHCYKKLCEYVASTNVFRNAVSVTANNGGISNIAHMIREGMNVQDDCSSRNEMAESSFKLFSGLPDPTTNVGKKTYKKNFASNRGSTGSATGNPPAQKLQQYKVSKFNSMSAGSSATSNSNSHRSGQSLYSVTLTSYESPKIKIKRKYPTSPTNEEVKVKKKKSQKRANTQSIVSEEHVPSNGLGESSMSGSDSCTSTDKEADENSQTDDKPKKPKPKMKKGCRCGTATPSPGKLTCCGQRCPCYVDGKCCLDCRCRGCRNPFKPDGTKVVPDFSELLEQNLSSMAESSDESCEVDVDV